MLELSIRAVQAGSVGRSPQVSAECLVEQLRALAPPIRLDEDRELGVCKTWRARALVLRTPSRVHSRPIWSTGLWCNIEDTAAINQTRYAGQTVAAGCNLIRNPVSNVFTSRDYGGRTPPKAPRFAGRLGAAYKFDIQNDVRAVITGDVSRTSRYNFTDTLRPDAVQKGYTKLDAAIRVIGPGDRWSVALIGRNLTNEYVVSSANDIPFAGGTGTGGATGVLADMSAIVENPREVFLELSLKF